MRERLRRLRKANPGRRVEVWAQDEARLGLKPVARRVWAARGRRPLSCGRTRYEWLYVYGFARPSTGETFCALLPRVNAGLMGEALAACAAHADPEGREVLVPLVDNAGWHTARRLAVPANVVLHFLPACTPELQPAEPLWPLVREALANRTIGRVEYLRRVVRRRLRHLAADPQGVRPLGGPRWAARLER